VKKKLTGSGGMFVSIHLRWGWLLLSLGAEGVGLVIIGQGWGLGWGLSLITIKGKTGSRRRLLLSVVEPY